MFGLLSLTHIVMLQIYNLCLYTTRFTQLALGWQIVKQLAELNPL